MTSPRLCIITTNKDGYSETFVRNHIRHLPFAKTVLYQGSSPVLYEWEDERPLINPQWHQILRKVFFKDNDQAAHRHTSRYLSKYLRRKGIQVVLAEFGPVGENVAEACRLAKIPLVVHFHGDDAHRETMISRNGGYRRLIDYAQSVICVSQAMKEQLRQLGFADERLHLIPYGIDTQQFGGGNPATSEPIFLAVGRFVDKKAPYLTVLAFREVLEKVPTARLVMAGQGSLLGVCQALAKALKIEHAIDFKGVCTSEEISGLMKEARTFVMHSVTPPSGEKEGTPLSILEASATGLPVVSTRHAGISEAVIPDKSGFLTDEYDVEQMAVYLTRLAEDPVLAQSLGETGRKHVAVHYELSRQIAKLATVIRQAAPG